MANLLKCKHAEFLCLCNYNNIYMLLQPKWICSLLGHKFYQKLNYLMLVLLQTYHVSSSQGFYAIVDGNSGRIFALRLMPSCIKYKYTFNNSTAERVITVCCYKRSYPKQLEYITKGYIVIYKLKTLFWKLKMAVLFSSLLV